MPEICIVAACEQTTRAMGINNDLIWKGLKPDMARFKVLTVGQAVIMGKNTWKSLPPKFRPLPDRLNFVVSSTLPFEKGMDGQTIGLEQAIRFASTQPIDRICLIGGARIYEEGLELADTLYLTLIDDPNARGDVFFPPYEQFGRIVDEEEKEEKGLKFRFVTMKRAAT